MSRKLGTAQPNSGPKGSLRIRVNVGLIDGHDFGRLEIRTGAQDQRSLDSLRAFVHLCVERRDAATLRRISEGGRKSLLQEYRAFLAGNSGDESSDHRPLVSALLDWHSENRTSVSGRQLSLKTVASYRQSILDICKFTGNSDTVKDLGDVLYRYREYCDRTGQNFRFRQAKTMALSFSRKQHRKGRYSSLYISIAQVENMHADRKRERLSDLRPDQVLSIQEAMRAKGYEHLAHHVWNIAALACRPDEYVRSEDIFEIHPSHEAVLILGTKYPSSRRFVPLLPNVKLEPRLVLRTGRIRNSLSQLQLANANQHSLKSFRRAFKEVTAGKYAVYDLRASGFSWMRKAGIDPIMRRAYFGHSMKGLDERYQTFGNIPVWSAWEEDIRRDAKLLRQWVTASLAAHSMALPSGD